MAGSDFIEHTDKTRIIVAKKTDSSEKPVGEWNALEVICKGSTIEAYINGTLQNKATGVTISEGSICLQSEGKDIEFRNVYIIK